MNTSATKYQGLGRGLETLLNPTGANISANPVAEATVVEASGLQKLPIFSLRSGPYQPRKDFNEVALDSLAQSIKNEGLLQPIVVQKIADQQYEIIAGERRWRAAQRAGLSEVLVIVRDDIQPQQAMAVALIENIQREDLNAVEEAEGFKRLYQEFNLTHEQIADIVGRSRAAVTNSLRLLDLDDRIQQLVRQDQLKMGHVRALLPLGGEQQWQLAQTAVKNSMSVRQVETAVQSLLSPNLPASAIDKQMAGHMQVLQQQLKQLLRNDVSIQVKRNGSGKIQIPFGSINELRNLVQVWSQALTTRPNGTSPTAQK